ncbi:methyl-accepting chemotaxis protein [Pseudomonas sp. ESBL1]|uniref:methyl-accepting chemotaxis protein n=1 Tax=Pseudomonas sp. ESBL1 TaxID=3077324 RepID=UPI002FC97149
MYQGFAHFLGNMSVNRKLGFGFGLVLLLTLAITATGWTGIDNVTNRGDKLGNISLIYQTTQELRIARLNYTTRHDQASLTELDKTLDKLEQQVQAMLGQIEQPVDHQRLEQQLEAVRQYRQGYEQLQQADQRRATQPDSAQTAIEQALQHMATQGNVLLESSAAMTVSQTKVRDEGTRQAKRMLAAATALALLLGLLAAWTITRQIIVPLRQILAAAERVANGDLSQDDQSIERRDELGQLQASMKRMNQGLRTLISGIGDGVTQIASAAEELSAVTEQTSAGVNNQKVETDQVATAMNQMTATVHEVARSAEQASEAALMADQQAREGDRVVGEAIAQIERLASEVVNSSEAMNQLKAESDKIGSVLDVIKSVAQQTNLLALNAAIEAARAGEAGRGFAVVADEVRSLAQRTQQSTEEIEELIASLQSGTQRVAGVMDGSRALTDSSVELTRRAGGSLETITRTVSSIQAMNQQIATAAEQQSATAEEINRSVMSVRDISDQTSAASEETASSSVELARLGTHLQGLVARFRL